MENKDFNKRILEKLENKIAIENFKSENKIENRIRKNKFSGVKIASLITVTALLAGNIITYATTRENLFKWVLDRIGISKEYEQEKIETNLQKNYNNITVTLKDYGIDKENLIIGFNLNLSEKVDFIHDTFSNATISDGNNIFDITEGRKSLFYKVSDKEYIIYEIYNIDALKIKENSVLNEKFKLYKSLDEVSSDLLGEWSFDVKLDVSKINTDIKEYLVNKTAYLKETNDSNFFDNFDLPTVDISRIKITNIATKLYMKLDNYSTDPSSRYTVEILDEKGNVLLNKDEEYLIGGVTTGIIFEKIDLNQKIKVNFYNDLEDANGKYATIAKASLELDLNQDLSDIKVKEKNTKHKQFGDITFEYEENSDSEIYEEYGLNISVASEYTRDTIEIPIVYNDEIIAHYSINKYKNIYNDDLETIFNKLKLLEYAGGYGFTDQYTLMDLENDKEYLVSQEELLKYAENGYIDINGERVELSEELKHDVVYKNIQNVKIDKVDAISWISYYGETVLNYIFVVNGEIYEIRCPSNFNSSESVQEFLSSIKILK